MQAPSLLGHYLYLQMPQFKLLRRSPEARSSGPWCVAGQAAVCSWHSFAKIGARL